MKQTKLFLLLFIGLFLTGLTETKAQSGGINLTLGFPRGEFYQFVKRTGIGVSIEGLIYPYGDKTPFGIGANIGFMTYGNETRSARWSTTIPDATVDVERNNNIANFHLLIRLQTNNTLIRPYLDLLFGGSYLYTETTVRNNRSSEEISSSNNSDDWAWSYGGGGGFLVKLTDMDDPNTGGKSPLYLDVKVRYLMGSEAQYLREGDVIVDETNGTVKYFFSKSKTDLLTFNIGVHAYFSAVGF